MNIDTCRDCLHHKEELTDSILCNFYNQVNYFIIDGRKVISCPKDVFLSKKTG